MEACEESKIEDYQNADDSQLPMQLYIPTYPALDPPFVQYPPVDPRAPPTTLHQIEIIESPIEFQGELSDDIREKQAGKWGTVIFIVSFALIVIISSKTVVHRRIPYVAQFGYVD